MTSQSVSSRRVARRTNEPNCSAAKASRVGRSTLDIDVVDADRPLALVDDELDLVPGDVLRDLEDVHAHGRHAPDVRGLPEGERVVRRLDQVLEGVGQRRQRVVGQVVVGEDRPVRERDEVGLVAGQLGRLGARHGVPLADAGDAVDAGNLPDRMAGIDHGRAGDLVHPAREVEAALPGQLLVDRLAPAEEAHYDGSISP